MRNSGRVIQLLILATITTMSLSACSGTGSQGAATPVPTLASFIPLHEPGMVNADAIPVRTGPGTEYQQMATINHDYAITVVGQSADGKWYKVEIPGYVGDQGSLWIAVDFVTVSTPTEIVTMTAVMAVPPPTTEETIPAETIAAEVLVPSPIATSQPSTSSCGAPAGWVTYVVQPGDTLFRLATKTNTTTEQVMRANCLTSNQIVTGTRLYLPFVPAADTQFPPQTPLPTTSGTVPPFPTSTSLAIQTPSGTNTAIPIETPTNTVTTTPTQISRQTPTDTPQVSLAATSVPIHTPTDTPWIAASATLPATTATSTIIPADYIRNFQVISETARELQFTADYYYDGYAGEVIFSARCLNHGQSMPCGATAMNPWQLGGSASGRLTVGLGLYGPDTITTDQIIVLVFRRSDFSLVYYQKFNYIKSWMADPPTPTMVQ